MADYDAVIIGSGINSLVAAALLGKKGLSVCLLERNDRLGGTIRTEEATLPGFHHDMMSCWYPLFVTGPAYAALKDDLHAAGLEFCFAPEPSGVILPDQSAFVMAMDREKNIAAFNALSHGEGDAHAADLGALMGDLDITFSVLGGNLWSFAMLKTLGKEVWRRKAGGMAVFAGDALRSCRSWLETTYSHPLTHAMFAPWVLHTGLGPESAASGAMGRVIAFTLEQAGMPVVKGGSSNLVAAFEKVFAAHSVTVMTQTHVSDVLVSGGKAVGVRTGDGADIMARTAVLANVPPNRLYGEMLPADALPQDQVRRAKAYRFGRADMQVHLALDKPAAWTDERLNSVPGVHVTPGMDGVSQAVNEAERGFLPREATIVAGQPAAHDPSRVPDGKGQLWIQLQELPRQIKGDAAGEIAVPEDGAWTSDVAERYADRIVARLEHHIPGLTGSILARKVLSPTDLESLNCNLVGGDPYCGDCGLDQFAIWRPFPGAKGHKTPVKNLWHIGASTHPGPGLGGGSGFLAAQQISG
ncbi:MAG: NAD(P)/FAD-dependent oxidoreductase [Pseudomonadota bacterium]